MKLNLPLMLSLPAVVLAALERRTTPTGCHADNCLRAIRATSQLPQASQDCSSFLVQTLTPPAITATVTVTISSIAFVKRTADYGPTIPTYASACTDIADYSSACSCIGITGTTITLTPSTTIVTAYATATPSCDGQTCSSGFVPSCEPDNVDCFCFTNSRNVGFCGQNDSCEGLTPCQSDDDCTGDLFTSGDTCAISTCCGDSGICLVGSCDNPLTKLRRMSREVARSPIGGDTAAFRAH